MYRRIIAALLTTLFVAACSSQTAQIPAPQPTRAPQQANTLAAAPSANTPTLPPATTTIRPTSAPTAAAATEAPTQVEATAQPSPAEPTAEATDQSFSTGTAARMALGNEILFLRKNNLIAYGVDSHNERVLAQNVRDFVATPDGRLIALVRGEGLQAELWLVNRDGSGLRQLTNNNRAEGTLALAPDGLTLAFSASEADIAPGHDWGTWSRWSRQSEVRLLNIATGEELLLGAGTDPAFSPDGRRVAFATAPARVDPSSSADFPLGSGNAIRLVNRKGQNGWNFATAGNPAQPDSGLLVYAPAFSPDGKQLAYKRYAGVQVETDIVYTELGNSFAGKAVRIGTDSGWFAPRFAPDGSLVALTDNFAGGQRGWGGYEEWSASVLRPGGTQSVAMPEGQVEFAAEQIDRLPRGQHVVWSPAAPVGAVQLPAGWQPNAPLDQPTYTEETAGELWRWTPSKAPFERLVSGVDFASPLLWLPSSPTVETHAQQGYGLTYPAGWQLDPPTEFEEITVKSSDGAQVMSAAPTMDAPVASAFPTLVAEGAKEETAVTWPDGSLYREFSGISPDGIAVAGAVRVTTKNGNTVLAIYRTTPERWPFERAEAQGLLAASGVR